MSSTEACANPRTTEKSLRRLLAILDGTADVAPTPRSRAMTFEDLARAAWGNLALDKPDGYMTLDEAKAILRREGVGADLEGFAEA